MGPAQAGHVPDLEKFLKSIKGQPLEASVNSLLSMLRRKQILGSEACAIATAHVLLQVVAKSKWHDADQLLEQVQRVGKKLVQAQPGELAIGNITRRVLGLIRDEAEEDRDGDNDDLLSEMTSEAPSETEPLSQSQHHEDTIAAKKAAGAIHSVPRPPTLTSFSSFTAPKTMFHILSAEPLDGSVDSGRNSGVSTPLRPLNAAKIHALRAEIINGIEEVQDEISQVDDQIAAVADMQILPDDYVMVHRPSRTVAKFLLRAASRRQFTLFIVTIGPLAKTASVEGSGGSEYKGLKEKLTALGVTVLVIAPSAVVSILPSVNKVLLAARTVVPSGGAVVDLGAGALARAAKAHGKQVIILVGVYRISPIDPGEESLVEWDAPAEVPFGNATAVESLEVKGPVTEFVRSELVDSYISNLGIHAHDHLPSIIDDHYKPEDIEFHLWNEAR